MAQQADRCCNADFYMAMWILNFDLQWPIRIHRLCQTFICWFEPFSQHRRSQRLLFTCLDLLAEALVLFQSLCFLRQCGLTLLKLLTCVFTSRLCNHKFFCSVKNPQEISFFPLLSDNIYRSWMKRVFLFVCFWNGSQKTKYTLPKWAVVTHCLWICSINRFAALYYNVVNNLPAQIMSQLNAGWSNTIWIKPSWRNRHCFNMRPWYIVYQGK